MPLVVLLALQYWWLQDLQRSSLLARQATLQNYLGAVSSRVEFYYRKQAERALNLPASLFSVPEKKKVEHYLAKKKPDPLPLLHAAEKLGVKPEKALMIGDSQSDVKAARAAGFQIVCMSYGYNHGEDIRDYHPDAVIDSMVELKGLLEAAA